MKTQVYVVVGEQESLLGKDDAIRLDIIKLDPQGEVPDTESDHLKHLAAKVLGYITSELFQDQINEGVVLGGQT